jgi:hypothetical protein
VVSSRPPRRQKTKEKLKNLQQPTTQAVESQEGLKQALRETVKRLAKLAPSKISRRVETA